MDQQKATDTEKYSDIPLEITPEQYGMILEAIIKTIPSGASLSVAQEVLRHKSQSCSGLSADCSGGDHPAELYYNRILEHALARALVNDFIINSIVSQIMDKVPEAPAETE